MRFILIALIALVFAGCTKTQICDNAKKVTAAVTPVIAAAAECENPAAVEAWANSALVDVKLCEKQVATGPVGQFLCPYAYDAIHAALLKGLPAEAKCKKIPGEDTLKESFLAACTKI